MSERTFVVIFFFWAALTIVTPTLILLSESSKPDLHSNVDKLGGVLNPRRMMGYAEKQAMTTIVPSAAIEAPTPSPAPEPVLGIRWSNFRRIFEQQ
ncbi:hypothetical protein JCGZ_04450 [Jatropha curcas]|uniref:Uncharacterized protein n=1 Tax=Jatropha curcas TaxID=180498 RepID=A0A067L205_JATCU|nr:uncharacterized protein LOC105633814 [Jatropha curcas]KDP38525.1 hypothetical protein JCGZ_04450 [Jatropha curcas]